MRRAMRHRPWRCVGVPFLAVHVRESLLSRLSTSRSSTALIWAASSRRVLPRSRGSCSRCLVASTSSNSTRGAVRIALVDVADPSSWQLSQTARPNFQVQDSVQKHRAAHAVRQYRLQQRGEQRALLHCAFPCVCPLLLCSMKQLTENVGHRSA
jgi:hypothetical protein